MDADALREFDELAGATGTALYGQTVRIGTVELRATCPAPVVEGGLIQGAEAFAGNLVLWVNKRLWEQKTGATAAPKADAEVRAHGRVWLVRTVTGEGDGEAEWCLRCEVKN